VKRGRGGQELPAGGKPMDGCLGHLKDLNIPYGADGWVFLKDKQKGLLKAIDQYFPMAGHRMFAWHIYANWRKKHRLQEYFGRLQSHVMR
jgi:hypothetical protein